MKRSFAAATALAASAVCLPLASWAGTDATSHEGASAIRILLKPVNGYHESGVARLTPTRDGFTVKLTVGRGPATTGGHTHIHDLSCARYARIAPHPHAPTGPQLDRQLATVTVYLTDIYNGKSSTDVTEPLAKFLRGGYSINVHIPNDPYTAVMCGDLPRRAVGSSAARATASASPAPALVRAAFNRKLKKTILVDAKGITLYAFAQERAGKPTCNDDSLYHCSRLWPPLVTSGQPRAGKGVNAKLLGVARRQDGRLQVTYDHLPLYEFANATRKRPGDVSGQNYLGLWWVVSPSGKKIT